MSITCVFFLSLKLYHILSEPQRQHIPLQLNITTLSEGNGLTEMFEECYCTIGSSFSNRG